MLNPARLDITIYQGSTFFKRFTWREKTSPINISDYEFRMQIRPSVDSSSVIAEFSSDNGDFYIEDEEEGKFILEVSNNDTEEYDFDRGVYDIECIFPDGRVSRILYGTVTLSKEVTR